jgi:hypothetical protein
VVINRDLVRAACQAATTWSRYGRFYRGEISVADLKLGPLPKHSTVKVTIVLAELLKEELDAYAAEHGKLHGKPVETAELIPHMLEAFLRADRAWCRLRKQRGRGQNDQRRDRRRSSDELGHT